MKRSERHRLKENELSHALSEATARLAQNQRDRSGRGGRRRAVVLGAAGGYWAWTAERETRAQSMLAEALMTVQSPVEEPKPGDGNAGRYPAPIRRFRRARKPRWPSSRDVTTAYPSTEGGHRGAVLRGRGPRDAGPAGRGGQRATRKCWITPARGFLRPHGAARPGRGERAGEAVRPGDQRWRRPW